MFHDRPIEIFSFELSPLVRGFFGMVACCWVMEAGMLHDFPWLVSRLELEQVFSPGSYLLIVLPFVWPLFPIWLAILGGQAPLELLGLMILTIPSYLLMTRFRFELFLVNAILLCWLFCFVHGHSYQEILVPRASAMTVALGGLLVWALVYRYQDWIVHVDEEKTQATEGNTEAMWAEDSNVSDDDVNLEWEDVEDASRKMGDDSIPESPEVNAGTEACEE